MNAIETLSRSEMRNISGASGCSTPCNFISCDDTHIGSVFGCWMIACYDCYGGTSQFEACRQQVESATSNYQDWCSLQVA